MHLHERTTDTSVYMLSGQLPLVANLHKRVLGTLGSVLRSNSIERELAERQILLKDKNRKVDLSMSVQFYLSTICQVPLTF